MFLAVNRVSRQAVDEKKAANVVRFLQGASGIKNIAFSFGDYVENQGIAAGKSAVRTRLRNFYLKCGCVPATYFEGFAEFGCSRGPSLIPLVIKLFNIIMKSDEEV